MNIVITTFTSPFSFFCKVEDYGTDFAIENKTDPIHFSKTEFSDVNHGQYVAVMWNNKWTRGIVTLETKFLIWLVDYGIYLRPNEKTVYIDLPACYKKYPTKVFEASIHGVIPIDKIMTEDCQIKNAVTTSWNKGTIAEAQMLIDSALKVHFVPVTILSTKHNDIVLGELYLKMSTGRCVNIVDQLEMWPVFLERNQQTYIENLPVFYTSRRHHRACLLKPEFPDFKLSEMTTATSLAEYNIICAKAPRFEFDTESETSSIIVNGKHRDLHVKKAYKLTPEEIEKYARMVVTVCERKYNVLNVLSNKARDLSICERYKDHDVKSVGRANFYRHSCAID